MDRRDEIEDDDDEVEATFLITGDDMFLIMKALDVYAYALIISQSQSELMQVKEVAEKILVNLPKAEFDA